MSVKILMPSLSPTMTEGNLAKWLKKEGDSVKAGDVIAEIETDKATMEVETIDDGIIGKILVSEGSENVAVGSLIAILLEEGETQDDIAAILEKNKIVNGKVLEAQSGNISPVLISPLEIVNNEIIRPEKRVFISPLAKRMALAKNINIQQLTGSGPYGRIVKADIEAFKPASLETTRDLNEYTLLPHNNIRKITAKRLQESKQQIPHFYLSVDCNMDKLLSMREDINQKFTDKENKISVNDFIIIASAKALKEVKEVNASWMSDAIKYYNNVDISVAVATTYGLITPIIKNADNKNIIDISKEMKILASKAKANKLTPEEFQGGGFSISNLGMFGIKNFNAIINPPQSAILAIGASSLKVIVDDISKIIKTATIMEVTLSCDHRVIDGAVGAKFLSVFKNYIEHPALLLL